MGGSSQQKTALGVARARFIEALPRKSKELGDAVEQLRGAPEVSRLREEMRRRLHALYASAQVFREEALASAVKTAIERLDRARDSQSALASDDIEALKSLAVSLPALGSSQVGKPSVISIFPPRRSSQPERSSLRTIAEPEPKLVELRKEPPAIPPLPPFARGAPRPNKSGPLGRSVAQIESMSESRVPPDHQTPISVLVLDDRATTEQIKESLPAERFEVLATDNPDEALRLARSSAPDLILADYQIALRAEVDFVARLRGDPLTDLVPVFALIPAGKAYESAAMRDAGIDQVVFKPVDGWALLRAVGGMVAGPAKVASALDGLAEATVDEVVERVTQEIRYGLSESLQAGRERKIPLGEGHEILAAAWGAIGRIRAHLSFRSEGGIRFRDGPRRGGPSVLALVDGGESYPDEGSISSSLEGRQFLVVDDDPGVRWFFAGLLKEAGALVAEASNGQEALEAARNQRPDIVVSDILMPGIDGFALCQELKRDVILADVPVILISWKEDLLAHMRELQSGASGYLRKEAGAAQILERIHQVLRPIARLEAQLRTGGEVRGRLEGLGVLTLLKTVGRERPNARVTVRDARSLFEIDFRNGQMVALTKTATDGSFIRGSVALQRLLAARSGRFTVVPSEVPVRSVFREPLASLLQKNANQLAALLDAVSDAHLVRAHKIALNEEILTSLLGTGLRPPPELKIIELLRRGESPKEMIVEGRVAPRELEACLDDLARRGAIAGVLGPNGEDRVAEALRIREERPGTLCKSPEATKELTKETVATASAEPENGDFWQDVDRDSSFEASPVRDPIKDSSSGGSVAEALRRIQEASDADHPKVSDQSFAAREAKTTAQTKSKKVTEPYVDIRFDSDPNLTSSATKTDIGQLIDSAIGSSDVGEAPPDLVLKLESEPPGSRRELRAPVLTDSSSSKRKPGRVENADGELAIEVEVPIAIDESEEASGPARIKGGMIEQALREELARTSLSIEHPPTAQEPSRTASAQPRPTPDSQKRGPSDARTRRWGWVLAATALIAGVYLSVNQLGQQSTQGGSPQSTADSTQPGARAKPRPTVDQGTQPIPNVPSEKPSEGASSAGPPTGAHTNLANGQKAELNKRPEELDRTLPFIDRSWGVKVPADEGLLVVEWKGVGNAPDVKIGDRKMGRPPFATALTPGRYELKFLREGRKSSRRLTVRQGVTRIVYAPE